MNVETVVNPTISQGVSTNTFMEVIKVGKTVLRIIIKADSRLDFQHRNTAVTERLGRSGWQKFDTLHYSQLGYDPIDPNVDFLTRFREDRDVLVSRATAIVEAYERTW